MITRGGGPEVLEAREVEDPPQLGDGEVLVQVAAAGVNRADTLQRHGRHPPPPGASPYPGLECSGTIVALGPKVPSRWSVGDKVKGINSSACALVWRIESLLVILISFAHFSVAFGRCARCLVAEGTQRRSWFRQGSCCRCRRVCH